METIEKKHQIDSIRARERQKSKPPSMYKVIILNDEYTTSDFVIFILQKIFSMSYERAEKVMLQSHHEGQAICGVFTLDIAETKAALVASLALQNGHPLRCTTEAA